MEALSGVDPSAELSERGLAASPERGLSPGEHAGPVGGGGASRSDEVAPEPSEPAPAGEAWGAAAGGEVGGGGGKEGGEAGPNSHHGGVKAMPKVSPVGEYIRTGALPLARVRVRERVRERERKREREREMDRGREREGVTVGERWREKEREREGVLLPPGLYSKPLPRALRGS